MILILEMSNNKYTKNYKKMLKKKVDLLEVNDPIPGQEFMVMSFVSPETEIKNKEIFFFQEFLKQWDFNKSMEKFLDFLHYICFVHNIKFDDISEAFKEFIEDKRQEFQHINVNDDYKTFLDKNEDRLEEKYMSENQFRTCIRGFKNSGNYPTYEIAKDKADEYSKKYKEHNFSVAQVGAWVPWDPTKGVPEEFHEPELNALMHEKAKNEANQKKAFDERIIETKKAAILENTKKAQLSGNVLTQTIDDNGNLIGIKNTNTQESALELKEEISTEDIQNELFEGDNIVIGKSDHRYK
jgi:hypothetical protein